MSRYRRHNHLIRRAQRGLKSLTMRWAGQTRRIRYLPRTQFNYRDEVGDGTGSSTVMAPLLWIGRTFPEAPVRLQAIQTDGTLVPQRDHAMVQRIERPNEFYSGALLMMASVLDFTATGNAYWLKVRSGAGRVVELWWAPSWAMEPDYPKDGSAYLSGYKYRPDPGKPAETWDVADVVHFRFGIDPNNTRKGLAPLASVLREVFTDDEAANFTAALLKNLGVPGVIIAPSDGDTELEPEDAEGIKADFKNKFGGDRRGEPMVLTAPVRVTVASFNPQQMTLKDLRRIPEERVTAVLGVPAIVAGLGAGLDRSTFANMSEAREMAYESNIIPTQRLFAAELKTQLLDDFDEPERFIVDFDLSGVRVLQEDENKKVERLNSELAGGGITLAEWRSARGYATDTSHDVYYLPISTVVVPVSELGQAVDVVPAPKALTAGRKATRRDAAFVARLHAQATHHEATYTRAMATRFRQLGAGVAAQVGELAKSRVLVGANGHKGAAEPLADWPADLRLIADGVLDPSALLPPDFGPDYLHPVVQQQWTAIADSTYGLASEQLGLTVGFNLDDPVAVALIRQGLNRTGLVDLDGQTKQAIRNALADGRDAGEGIDELVRRIRRYVSGEDLYPGIAAERGADAAATYRAQVIARTETRTAQNLSSLSAYGSSGVVEGVLVFDGDGCGFTGHGDSDLADGSTRTLGEAELYPLAHPQCVRAFAPIVRSV